MSKTLLFAYGLLQPAHQPPKTMTGYWPDRVHGLLYDLGPYPAAVDVEHSRQTFEGYVLEIDEAEIPAIDEFEEVHENVYARKQVMTHSGRTVWIYEYQLAIPKSLKPIPRWPCKSA